MDIRNELIKRLGNRGYKTNDEGDIVVKFSELIGGELATIEKLTLKISDQYIDIWWEGFDGKRMCLMALSSFKDFMLCDDEEFREISSDFNPEHTSRVMELLQSVQDILIEITSETPIPERQNETPKRYRTQSGKNFIDVLRNEMMSHERFLGFLEGNVYKYVFRYRNKGGKEDLRKAKHYLNLLEAEIDE